MKDAVQGVWLAFPLGDLLAATIAVIILQKTLLKHGIIRNSLLAKSKQSANFVTKK